MAVRTGGGAKGEVLNTAQAAALLGVDRKLLAKWAKAGKVPCQKPGKGYLFSRQVLLAWLGGGGVDDEVFNTAQAADFLGVDRKLLAKWAKAGKVPCRKPAKGYLFSKNALLSWLAGDLDVPGPSPSADGRGSVTDTPGVAPGRRRRGRRAPSGTSGTRQG